MRPRLPFICLAFILLLVTASIQAQTIPENLYGEMRWRMIGPLRGGRTRAVAGVPGHPATLYIGVCNGGVWRSRDYGRTWTPIFDDQPTQSIGAIAVAASDPNVIYVGSGEGLQRPDLSVGDGIYKSTDAGKSWVHLGLRDGQQIPSIAMDPTNPNRLFAAVLGHPYGPNQERGIFRSLDGAQTWEKVLYINENTGGQDVDIDPARPNVVYASLWPGRQGPWEDDNAYAGPNGGIYKSVDGGTTWKKLAGGLPARIVEANLSIAPSDSNRLYVVLATTTESGYMSGEGLGLYRSDDAGATWTKTSEDPRPLMRIGGGDLPMLGVDPKNPDILYSTSIVTHRSTDGGKTWFSLRGAPGGDDYQNIWIDPTDPNIILLASDQGAIVTVNGGKTWSSWYNQPTGQMYHVQTTHEFPYRVCGGQQESGSACVASRSDNGAITFRDWRPVGAIEYGYVTPDPLNPDIVYGAGRSYVSKHWFSTGQTQNVTPIPVRDPATRVHRTQPLMFSPVDPHVLYYASNFVYKTTDGAATWERISPDLARAHAGIPPSLGDLAQNDKKADKQRGVVYALGPSFKSVDTLWVGTDDGLIQVTRDGGQTWTNVTPPVMTPWSKVTQIVASHFDDQTAYASVSRLRVDDLKPYIYRTHDGGKSWQLIVHGLSNAPVNTVREDPVRRGLLYAGSETTVSVSFDDGDHWQSLQMNLPHSSMRDLWIAEDDLIVATHGRSFWILDNLSPLRQVRAEIAKRNVYLFDPATAIRVRRDLYTDTPLPADEPMGQNPPDGAIIDYVLGHDASGAVTLEILDADDHLVREYASTDKPEFTKGQLAKQMIPLYWVRPFHHLPTTAGMHRWVWDLRYPAPGSLERGYPIAAVPHDTPTTPEGPLVVPGLYTVRLTADGTSVESHVTVVMDPRVKISPKELVQQFQVERRLALLMTETAKAVASARSIREQIAGMKKGRKGQFEPAAERLDKAVQLALEGREAKNGTAGPGLSRLQGQAKSLYDGIGQVDTAPTSAQREMAKRVARDLRRALDRWKKIAARIPNVNKQLHLRGLGPLDPNRAPTRSLHRNEE